MKKLSLHFLLCIGLVFIMRMNIKAQMLLEGLSVSSDYSVFSKYVWRGFKLDSDPVAQAGVNVGFDFFSIGIWNSQDSMYDDAVNSAEVDFTFDVTKNFEGFAVSLGNTFYTFPAADAASREFYLGISLDTEFSPSLTWNKDYGDENDGGGNGNYISLGLSRSIPLTGSMTIDLSGNAGYNSELFINGTGGDVSLSTGLSLSLNDNLAVTPKFLFSVPFGDLADDSDGAQESEAVAGFSIAYGF